MKTLALFTFLILASCAPKAIVVIPTAPSKAMPVTPSAEMAARSAASTSEVSAVLENQVESLQKRSKNLQSGITAAMSEVERLRVQKQANEKEIDGLWKMLSEHESSVRDLFAGAETANATAEKQKALRMQLERDLAEVVRKASAKDNEAETLRSQRDDMVKATQSAVDEAHRLQALLTKAEGKAVIGGYLRGWVIAFAIALFIAVAGFLYLKFLLPQ